MIPEPQFICPPSDPPVPSTPDTPCPALAAPERSDGGSVPPEPSTLNHKPSTSRTYRPKGKIPNLPKDQRDLINNLLLDGATYSIVIAKMKEHGVSLNHENLSNWHNGGHQDWLYDQQWREDTRALQESALESLDDIDHARVNQAALHVAALQIFGALRNLQRGPLHEKLGGDSAAYSRLVNALSRATREALNAQKLQDARAHVNLKRLDPSRKASEKERNVILHHWRDFFGHDLTERAEERQKSEDQAPKSDPLRHRDHATSGVPSSDLQPPNAVFRCEDDAVAPPATEAAEAGKAEGGSEGQEASTQNPVTEPASIPQPSTLLPTCF
jgi:hypothetical protein